MAYCHIIEQTCDQQVVEVVASSQKQAVDIYLKHCTHEPVLSVTQQGSNTIVDYPTETCILWAKNEHLVYAKWISKLGLY